MSPRGAGRSLTVVLGAALVAVGVWLSSLLSGFGLGPGDGGGGSSEDSNERTARDAEPVESEVELAVPDDGPLRVVLEPRGYSVVIAGTGEETTYEPATLEEIVELAERTQPRPDGHRVRITARRTSIGTHADLVRRLEEAGIDPDEIEGYDIDDVGPESGGG